MLQNTARGHYHRSKRIWDVLPGVVIFHGWVGGWAGIVFPISRPIRLSVGRIGTFIKLIDSVYPQNPCASSPCPHPNSICQAGFTDRGYRCVCAKGFHGERCEKRMHLN